MPPSSTSRAPRRPGITIEVKREPGDGYWTDVWNKQPFSASYWGGRPTQDQMYSTAYYSKADWNDTRFKREDFDKMLFQARAELDPDKRKALYKSTGEMVRDEGGVIGADVQRLHRRHRTEGCGLGPGRQSEMMDGYALSQVLGQGRLSRSRTSGMSSALVRLIAQRIVLGILLMLAVSVLIFVGTQILPGDVAQSILGQSATPEAVANLRECSASTDPDLCPLFPWLGGVLTGDLGTSCRPARTWPARDRQAPVATRCSSPSGPRILSVPLAIRWAGRGALPQRPGRQDHFRHRSLASISLPEFFIGYLLILLRRGEASMAAERVDRLRGHVLRRPADGDCFAGLTLTFVVFAHMMRMTRAAILNVMQSAYIETAELKGLAPDRDHPPPRLPRTRSRRSSTSSCSTLPTWWSASSWSR